MADLLKFVFRFLRVRRKKIGCITLLIACLLMCGWTRSTAVSDFLSTNFPYGSGSGKQEILSTKGSLVWRKSSYDAKMDCGLVPQIPGDSFSWGTHEVGSMWGNRFLENPDVHWIWQFCGFGVGEVVLQYRRSFLVPHIEARFVKVPYWAILLPLALISFFLLCEQKKTNDQGAAHQSVYEPDKNQEIYKWLMAQKRASDSTAEN